MFNVKALVSRNRNRFNEDGFNLDLTYISPQIIAMGFPATGIEAIYRNSQQEVKRFLDLHHKNRYYIINLCSEKQHQYDHALFDYHVFDFPIRDHCPPTLKLLFYICRQAYNILTSNPENVIAVHCKAGKGRTGVVCCCILAYLQRLQGNVEVSHTQIIDEYSKKRTTDGRCLTIPSQLYYVKLFCDVLNENNHADLCAQSVTLPFGKIQCTGILTNIQSVGNITLTSSRAVALKLNSNLSSLKFQYSNDNDSDDSESKYTVSSPCLQKGKKSGRFQFEQPITLHGECEIETDAFRIFFALGTQTSFRFETQQIDWNDKKEHPDKFVELVLASEAAQETPCAQ